MKLRNRTFSGEKKPFASLIRNAVLITSLIAAPAVAQEAKPVAHRSFRCPSDREVVRDLARQCTDSTNKEDCMRDMLMKRIAPTPKQLGFESRLLNVSKNDVIFSKKSGEFIQRSDIRIKVRGVDRAGVEFEVIEKTYLDTRRMMQLGMIPTSAQLAQRPSKSLVSIFRINYDGTKAGGLDILSDLGIQDIEAVSSGKRTARVSYKVPKYCNWTY